MLLRDPVGLQHPKHVLGSSSVQILAFPHVDQRPHLEDTGQVDTKIYNDGQNQSRSQPYCPASQEMYDKSLRDDLLPNTAIRPSHKLAFSVIRNMMVSREFLE